MDRVKINEISIKVSSGLTPYRSNPEFWINGCIDWVKTEQIGERFIFNSNEKITKKALQETSIKLNPINTLSIAMYGEGKTRGSISILKKEMTTNQACCNIFLDKEKADVNFIYYKLKTQYLNLRSLSSGVRKNLNSNDIKDFEITIPDLLNQQKIAAVLSALDEKIELNNQLNSQLEQMAKTIYDYWFVQFDFPDENGKPYKSSGGKMVLNDVLKREIPVGWEVKGLNYFNLYQPQTISEKEMNLNGKYYVFGANGIVGKYNKFNHKNSEIVITCRGNSCGNIIRTLPESWITGNAMVVGSNYEYISKEFVFQMLSWVGLYKVITGSGQPQITRTNLETLNFILPDINIIEKFNEKVFSNVLKRNSLFQQNQELAQLRDWLLPMLMNGQVQVGSGEYEREEGGLGMVAEGKVKYKIK